MLRKVVSETFRLLPDPVKFGMAMAGLFRMKTGKRSATFTYRGKAYEYFYHPYGYAFRTERTVEVPIFMDTLQQSEGKEVLEVGNVLSHYYPVAHDILDKYEKAAGVINEDIVDYRPGRLYDLVLSISTLEHVGWSEDLREPEKVLEAVSHIRELLAPCGELIASMPIGYNSSLGEFIESGDLALDEIHALRSLGRANEWEEARYEAVSGTPYDRRTFRANAVMIVHVRA